MSRSIPSKTYKLAALFACVALTACGGGGGAGEPPAPSPSAPTPPAPPPSGVAADCAAFASGRYRLINPLSLTPAGRTSVLDLDAVALSARDANGNTTPLVANGGCQYTIDEGDYLDRVMVSPGGVAVLHAQAKSAGTQPQRHFAIALREQNAALAEFGATWHTAAWRPSGGGYVGQTGEITFGADGQATQRLDCLGQAACSLSAAPLPRLAANAGGGFDWIENGSAVGRAFIYENTAGNAVFTLMANDGSFLLATRKGALGALPAVGASSNVREFTLNVNGTLSTVTEEQLSVTAVDAGANAFSLRRGSDGRVDLLAQDRPRDGLRYRAAGACTIGGAAVGCAEAVLMPLRSMGIELTLSASSAPSGSFYTIAIDRP